MDSCEYCKQPVCVEDAIVTPTGRAFHGHHFLCGGCGRLLHPSEAWTERDGFVYCESDFCALFHRLCRTCDGPLLDPRVAAAFDAFRHSECAACWHAQQKQTAQQASSHRAEPVRAALPRDGTIQASAPRRAQGLHASHQRQARFTAGPRSASMNNPITNGGVRSLAIQRSNSLNMPAPNHPVLTRSDSNEWMLPQPQQQPQQIAGAPIIVQFASPKAFGGSPLLQYQAPDIPQSPYFPHPLDIQSNRESRMNPPYLHFQLSDRNGQEGTQDLHRQPSHSQRQDYY
ncbi:hypothetical protein BC830DRAFT_1127559 [Chytriomyces sp. MP71]|nr:hypothetical protein BC830DRAFT_1127559 [Chytriomyces sp. MP71]